MCIWTAAGDDVTGVVARVDKVAGSMERLLGGECYHYHSKLMMKEVIRYDDQMRMVRLLVILKTMTCGWVTVIAVC